jgi:ABC-type nitrate/sulfonate/bicarbonate transport system ATPase subunit
METADALNDVLRAQGVGKTFTTSSGQGIVALDGIELSIPANSFICIVGPSGCGKSTLLRIMAGLDLCTEGRVLYKGRPQLRPRRELGVIFQEYSLFPWRNNLDNVTMGLELAGVPSGERRRRGREYLELVGLWDYEKIFPHELSGGMRQRVAIARALANEPDVLLMDEPFGAIDAYTRILLQKRLLDIWEKRRKTVVFVTHSVDESVFLADRIVIMSTRPGRILAEMKIDLPRPRQRDNPRYAGMVAHILNLLEQQSTEE